MAVVFDSASICLSSKILTDRKEFIMPQSKLVALIYAFSSKAKAGQAYDAIRNCIHTHECSLCAYRYWTNCSEEQDHWQVLVTGEEVTFTFKEHMTQVLIQFGGKATTLPPEMLEVFYQRHRVKMAKKQGWQEQSYE
jgi:hypothetical protein